MSGLNISQSVSIQGDLRGENGDPHIYGRISTILFDEVQGAQFAIQAMWPIDTGRSFQAWVVLDESRAEGVPSVVLRNDARDKWGPYPVYVHRKGDPVILSSDALRPGGVVFEVYSAIRRVNERLENGTDPALDPIFAANRLMVARVQQALSRGETDTARSIQIPPTV